MFFADKNLYQFWYNLLIINTLRRSKPPIQTLYHEKAIIFFRACAMPNLVVFTINLFSKTVY
jgi:hypothetical protein